MRSAFFTIAKLRFLSKDGILCSENKLMKARKEAESMAEVNHIPEGNIRVRRSEKRGFRGFCLRHRFRPAAMGGAIALAAVLLLLSVLGGVSTALHLTTKTSSSDCGISANWPPRRVITPTCSPLPARGRSGDGRCLSPRAAIFSAMTA